jgi:hypothetical protein
MRSPRDRSVICWIEMHQVGGSPGQLGFQLHLLADAADFLRHHGKARAERAGARAFDQCVQRQHFHLVGNLLDRPGLLAGDLIVQDKS